MVIKRRIHILLLKFQDLVLKWFNFNNYNPKNVLIIWGEARSGSTWLMELIQNELDPLIIWEPLHPISGLIKKGLGDRPIIRNEHEKNYFINFMKEISTGKLLNSWVISKAKQTSKTFSNAHKSLLIKFVRGSRMYSVSNELDLRYKPILLRRHPIAVISSHTKKFGVSDFETLSIKELRAKILNNLVENYSVEQIKNLIDSVETRPALKLTQYCLTNDQFYRENNQEKYIIVEYENLLENPKRELQRIGNEWGLPLGVKFTDYRLGSSTSHKINSEIKPDKQKGKWQSEFSEREITEFKKVLTCFNWEYLID